MAERFILDVDIRFDKSEKNFQEFARRTRAAVQQANADAAKAAGQAVAPATTPTGIARETAQTTGVIRTQGQAAGLSDAQIAQAQQAAVAQGRAQVEALGGGQKKVAERLATFDRQYEKQYQIVTQQINEEQKQLAAERSSTTAKTQQAQADQEIAREKKVQKEIERRKTQAEVRRAAAVALKNDPGFQTTLAETRAANRAAREAAPDVRASELARAQRLEQEAKFKRDTILANDPQYRQLQEDQRRIRSALRGGLDPNTMKLSEDAIRQRAETEVAVAKANDQVRATSRRAQTASESSVRAAAERTAAERAYKGVVDRELRSGILKGNIDVPGGRFQRLTAGLGYKGGAGGDGLGLSPGQFLGGGLLTTLKFALPSLALYGAIGGIGDAIREAQELDKVFTEIDTQFAATFGDEGQQRADQFKRKIQDIAVTTGQAADVTGEIGRQFVAAFSDQTVRDSNGRGRSLSGQALAEANLEAISKGAAVTGIDNKIISDEGVATATAFNATMEQILNITTQLRNTVGADESELLNFLGDIAPAARDAGFSLEEIASIGAVTLRESGRSGSAIAEAYGRVLPAISESTDELLQLAAANDELNNQEFLGAVANNDTKTIFTTLLNEFQGLNKEAQDFVINLLGGRREAAALLPAFGDADKINEIIGNLDRNSGDLDRRFKKVQETLGQSLARLGSAFRRLGTELYEAGIGDALTVLTNLMEGLLKGVSAVASVFADINDATGGMTVKLLTLTGVVLGLTKALKAAGNSQLLSALLNNVATSQYAPGGTRPGIPGLAGRLPAGAYALNQTQGFIGPVLPGSSAAGFTGTAGNRLATFGGAARSANGAPPISGAAAAVIGLIGLSQVINSYSENDSQVEGAANELRDKMKAATIEQLKAIEEQRTGFLDRLSIRIFGEDLPEELAATEIGKRRAEKPTNSARLQSLENKDTRKALAKNINEQQLNDFAEFLLSDENKFQDYIVPTDQIQSEGYIKRVADAARAGDQAALDVLGRLYEYAKENGNSEVIDAYEEIVNNQKKKEAVDDTTKEIESSTQNLEQLKAGYEAGTVSLTELLNAYDNQIQTQRAALAQATDGNKQIEEFLAKTIEERGKIYAQAKLQEAELAAEMDQLILGDDSQVSDNQISRLTGLLNDSQFTDPKSRVDVAKKIAGLYRDSLQQQIDAAETAAEASAIAERGIAIDSGTRVELILAQLTQNNAAFKAFADNIKAATGADATTLVRAVFTAIANGDQAMIDFYAVDLKAKIAEIDKQIAARVNAMSAIVAAAGPDAVQQYLNAGGLLDSRKALGDLVSRLDTRNLNGFSGATDPGNSLNASARQKAELRKKAEEERIKKAEEEAEARRRFFEELERQEKELKDAQFNLFRAAVGDNPVAQANIDIAAADYELSKAKNEAERLNALANRIKANNALRDAFKAIFDSQIAVAKAIADAAGDTVKSATIDYFAAVKNLNDLITQDPSNEAAINNARASVIQAEASLRDSKVQKQLDDYAYLYDMEQITKEQYINYLTALRATLDPATQEDAFRDISRTIKQLQGDLAGDLNFNLPGNIDLPTLYEVRRANQSTSGSGANAIGYQDNRQISVQMIITNGMTQQQAADFLAGALGSNRTGYSFRAY